MLSSSPLATTGAFLLGLAAWPVPAAAAPTGQPRAETSHGPVLGVQLRDGVSRWLGIPFAAPPVGALRWRSPRPPAVWREPLQATTVGPACPQPPRVPDSNHWFGPEPMSEDCLTLNIWAPRRARRLPVLFWIHGGAFTVGSAALPLYSGEALARQGVMFVSANYRLGALGFLAHEGLRAEGPGSGNFGFLDQVAALRWMRTNAERFGGDPDNVTLMGQSAGAMSVSVLQASPLARGLFHRVIGLSGSSHGAVDLGRPIARDEAEARGRQWLTALGMTALGEARQASVARVLAVGTASVRPVLDDHLLRDPGAGRDRMTIESRVPALLGLTRDEGRDAIKGVTGLESYRRAITALYGADAGAVLDAYPAKDDAGARAAVQLLSRDRGMVNSMRAWTSAVHGSGAPVWFHRFDRAHPYAPGVTIAGHDQVTAGAYHTGDVPYWLGTLDAFNTARRTRDWTGADRSLSARMMSAAVAFARTGDPASAMRGTRWPRHRPDSALMLVWDDRVTVASEPRRDRLRLLAGLARSTEK